MKMSMETWLIFTYLLTINFYLISIHYSLLKSNKVAVKKPRSLFLKITFQLPI